MANMKTLIRIAFVIFIANRIDCLGGVCDNCCDCLKIKEYEEIKDEGNIAAESLVNKDWYNVKKENLVLKIFKKKDDNVSPSKGNGDKISIKLVGKDNSKITYLQEKGDELKLEDKKYVFFEIKTITNKTVYLYCSDVETSVDNKGIFLNKNHKGISVFACDIENVTNMNSMFYGCNSLKKLDIKKFDTLNITNMEGMFNLCSSLTKLDLENFNTTNVTNMGHMFFKCYNLTKLNLKNFDTSKVTNMESMFSLCSSLTKLDLKNFDTSKVTNMSSMFFACISLTNLDIENFNTTKVTDVGYMFFYCSSLKNLKFGQNFNTSNVTNKKDMFSWCDNLSDKIIYKILGINE